jgi:hypothetical protein
MSHVTSSTVLTVLFDHAQRKFLGRGGQWQSPEEFLRNPPLQSRDVIPTGAQPEKKKKKTDPGGTFVCEDGILYLVDEDAFGQQRWTEVGPCPW